jgi:hypothetical protein
MPLHILQLKVLNQQLKICSLCSWYSKHWLGVQFTATAFMQMLAIVCIPMVKLEL